MIFTFDYYESAKMPKYTEPVLSLFRKLNNLLMDSSEDLDRLVSKMQRLLETSRPKGNTSHIAMYNGVDSTTGGVYLSVVSKNGHSQNEARLRFSQVKGAIEHDIETGGYYYFNLKDKDSTPYIENMLRKESELCKL